MKRENLRKTSACAVIMCAALCLSACGANEDDLSKPYKIPNSELEGMKRQELVDHKENNDPAPEDENPENSSESSEENDTSVTNMESAVTVTIKSEDDVELTTDDGDVFYTITCSYPVVSIAGNEAAAEKINENILSQVESFHAAADESIKFAKEDLEYWEDEGLPAPFPYSSDLFFTVTRADNNVISFTENGYEYMGGAHGMPYSIGMNYDTNTGELIAFAELSDNPDAFRAETLAYNQALAQTEYYSQQMFNTDDITNGNLENTLYADGMWYLSTSGLVFMSPPYALAPYAAGTLEFTIPYSELSTMGLKEQYAYTGRQIVKLTESESYRTDLNGDGNEDSVSYYGAWVDDETDPYEYLTHLTINGTDFSQDGSDDVKEQLELASPNMIGVCLYDLDVNDNYVELAMLLVDWIHEEEDTTATANYYSRFFRYTEDGTLTYLGQADGDVTDPTVSVTIPNLQGDS
ncbi:MAG: DUF3298 and DUF4163 domain-containing protein [Lachnospiraceae bacterium]|nr:DUF3298 and DUF4163 domain-containing protein [Lachnospiraceae bacterium]